jgi:hypothetical protein
MRMMATKHPLITLKLHAFRRRRQSEAGSTLVLVLVFVTALGLAMSVLLGAAGVNLLTTTTVNRQDHKVYAADAGVAYGIQRLRLDSTACSYPGPTQALSPPGFLVPQQTVNDGWARSVSVTCRNLSGSSAGIGGFALVVTGSGNSITTNQGLQYRPVQGSVFNTGEWFGLNGTKAVDVQNGNILKKSDTDACLKVGTALPSNLWMNGSTNVPAGPYSYCTTKRAAPDAPHGLPDVVPPEAQAPSDCNGWTVYHPGTYDSLNTVVGLVNNKGTWTLTTPQQAYFASGVYYFDNVNLVIGPTTGNGVGTTFAGAAGPDKPVAAVPPQCDNPQAPNGTGAEFIFGGTSTLSDTKNTLEIFARSGGPLSEGSPGLSLLQVGAPPLPQTGPPWDPSTAPVIVNVSNSVNFYVHGIVYAPNAQVNLNAVNTGGVKLMGGAEVNGIQLDAPASTTPPGDFVISIDHSPGLRKVLITSTAIGATNDKQIVSTAVVDIPNDVTATPTIESWSTAN